MNLKPVKLMNKLGANICWWNSLIQLFASTRDQTIVNVMINFINEHKIITITTIILIKNVGIAIFF